MMSRVVDAEVEGSSFPNLMHKKHLSAVCLRRLPGEQLSGDRGGYLPYGRHRDGVTSPQNAVKALAQTSEYEPYGQLLNRTLTDGVGFTEHVQDAATGLTYMQQRYYDPAIGAMLSVDPVTAYDQPLTNFNRYAYASNNPYKFTDPDGRQVSEPHSCHSDNSCVSVEQAQESVGRDGRLLMGLMAGSAVAGGSAAIAGAATTAALANPVAVNNLVIGAMDVAAGDAVGGASLTAGAAGAAGVTGTAGVAKDFFSGAKYTDKALGQMKQGDFHAFPESVKAFQGAGQVTKITGGDGVVREMLAIPGGYKGKEGAFEFMKDANGSINHRLFKPDKEL